MSQQLEYLITKIIICLIPCICNHFFMLSPEIHNTCETRIADGLSKLDKVVWVISRDDNEAVYDRNHIIINRPVLLLLPLKRHRNINIETSRTQAHYLCITEESD